MGDGVQNLNKNLWENKKKKCASSDQNLGFYNVSLVG